MNKPFYKTGILGMIVIGMSLILLVIFPSKAEKMPDGFITPIIAFEFIETRAEVYQMFIQTDSTIRQPMVDAMNLGNYLDYIYMCMYSLFLFLFCVKCAEISNKKFYYLGAVISLIVLAGDAFENIQLLGITANIENGNFENELTLLHVFTWIKWGGLTVIFLLLVPWFLKGGKFSKAIAIVGGFSFILGLTAYFHRSIINEIFSLSVAVMFILMIVYCFKFKNEN